MRNVRASRAIGGLVAACLFTTPFVEVSSAQSATTPSPRDTHVLATSLTAVLKARRDLVLPVASPQSKPASAAKQSGSTLKWILIAAAAGGGATAYALARQSHPTDDSPTITLGTPVIGAP